MHKRMPSCAVDGAVLVAVSTAGRTRRGVDPDRLDITREDPPVTLTFGGGIHYCPGAHLARVGLAEALRAIAVRMPNLRRIGAAPWKSLTELTGPITLPIEFDAGH
ncbi:MAG: hypothetical protein QOI25_4447 [Mycobacterium sp.]|nr:hypothetical protein [Mycobacterium sp.]